MDHSAASGRGLRLFVVHADEDASFVEGFLLEALRLPEGEVLVSSQLEPGAVVINEIARGALSPVTGGGGEPSVSGFAVGAVRGGEAAQAGCRARGDFDLFSMKLSDGYPLKRKLAGKTARWQKTHETVVRVPMLPTSYLEREAQLAQLVPAVMEEKENQ